MVETYADMSLTFQECCDRSGDICIADDSFEFDMLDLSNLLSDSFAATFDIGDDLGRPLDLSQRSSTLMINLNDLQSDKFITIHRSEAHSGGSSEPSNGPEEQNQVITKKSKGRKVSKVQKSSKTSFRKGMTVKEVLEAGDQQPNMSRRTTTNVLVAFPAFDKCDSLVYFPTTLIRYLNTSDIDAATKLLNKYMHKKCTIMLQGKQPTDMSLLNFSKMMTVTDDLEPDRIMCVRSTKVVENKIMATIYVKVTDIQSLYTNLSRTSSVLHEEGVQNMGIFPDRLRRFQYYAAESSHSEQVAQDLIAYSQQDEDVLIYMRVDFSMTIDDVSKKIVHFTHSMQLSSVHLAGTNVELPSES